jgi:TRAP-type transport system periplasmic protein
MMNFSFFNSASKRPNAASTRQWTRGIFLALLAALWIAGWLSPGPLHAAPPQTVLKIATLSPEGTALMKALKDAGRDIAAKTGNRVSLKIYPGGVMGNDSIVLKKMRSHQLDGATFTAGGIADEYSNYQVLSLPMIFQNYREADAVRAIMEPLLTQGLEQKGYISMGIIEAGFVYTMSNTPIDSLEKLRGRKVWIPEGDYISARAFKKMGVPPVSLSLPDVLTSLQTGMLDTVSNSPVATVVLQWFTRVSYLTETPLLYAYGTLAFSRKAWNKIPVQDQPVVRDIMTRQLKQVDKSNRMDNKKAMETLKKQGMKFVAMKPESYARMQNISNQTIDELVKEGLFRQDFVSKIRATVASIRKKP